jgi:hypothetical protein
MISGVAQVIGMKPILRLVFSSGHRQHAGDRRHGGAFAHGAQETAAFLVLREDGLDQRGLDELVAVGLELGGLAAAAQLDGRAVGHHLGVVVGQCVVASARALHHEWTVGVVGVEEFGHDAPRELMTGASCKLRASAGLRAGPSTAGAAFRSDSHDAV